MELEENEEDSFKAYRKADQREPNEKRFIWVWKLIHLSYR